MKIAIGSDHAGLKYKEAIKAWLIEHGHEVRDFGTQTVEPCDYPDFVRPAAEAVANGDCQRAIVLGGSGNGQAIVANKIKGIRCSLCWDIRSAKLTRLHDDANVLAIGEQMMSIHQAFEIIELWLDTDFEGGRYQRRIDKIEQ